MADDGTLLSYLVPRLTSHIEDAATDALAYILNNKSGEAMGALNSLIQDGGFGIEPIKRVRTQVSYADDCRPDMTGYDEKNVERLLVESKFWASLGKGQASDYIKHLDKPGPGVLLFISPEARMETLWVAIERDMEPCSELKPVAAPTGVQRVEAGCPERHLMLLSWTRLLKQMAAQVNDAAVEKDIQQLRGLVLQQDEEAFLPIHAEDLSPDFARRIVGYNRLVDDAVVARGAADGWIDISRANARAQRYGYGRYFYFTGVSGYFWFGVNHEQWAGSGDTPLWLLVGDDVQADMEEIASKLDIRPKDRWLPIYPKRGVEYAEVLDAVVRQLETIARIVGVRPELLLNDSLQA